MTERILVVGGGLAGCSAAIALASRGHDVDLLDLDARTDGAQIGISARAVDALAELGVLDTALARGKASMAPVFDRQYDAHGDKLPGPPGPSIPPRPDGRPAMIVIYRPYLAEILEARAREVGVRIRRPVTIERFAALDDGVRVITSDGVEETVGLLVGAEGLHSPTRRTLFGPQADSRYVGSMSLRWTVRDMPPGQGGFYHADDAIAIVGLMRDDMTYVASGVVMENRRVEQVEAREMLRGVLDRFDAPYLRELRARLNDDQEVIARPYETVRLTTDWHVGRTVVIGDAAHATTPNLSSGGGMALEDGVVLGQEIGGGGDVEAALARFCARRRPRAELVVDHSLRIMALDSAGAPQSEISPLVMTAMRSLAMPY